MKVIITNPLIHNIYGIKPTDEFDADTDNGETVKLSNGWIISSKHVKHVFDLENVVKEQLGDFIEENYAFTAYDVTVALRTKFSGEVIAHYKVRDIVHRLMDGVGSYNRSLIDVGKDVQPWLYYPEDFDPELYHQNLCFRTETGTNAQVGSFNNNTYLLGE